MGVKVAGGVATLGALGAGKARAREDSNPWAYDVSPYMTTDPDLIRYSEGAPLATPIHDATCLALDSSGHVWLAGGKRVVALTPDGNVATEFSVAHDIHCLCVEANRVYAGSRDRVRVHDTKGVLLETWETPGQKAYLTSIAASGNHVFVADAGQRIVHRHDPSGRLLSRIGARDVERGVPGFIVPSPFFALVMGADGLLRVANTGRHRVELYTVEGDLELAWGRPGMGLENFSGCCNPIDLALLPDGRTVTFEKGIPRIKIYSPTGEFECVVAGPESFSENAKVCGPNDCTLGGMAGVTDGQGRVLVVDFVTGKVRVFEPKGGSQ
jgi:hypothetical protein